MALAAARETERNKMAAERLRAQLLGDAEAERATERRLHAHQLQSAAEIVACEHVKIYFWGDGISDCGARCAAGRSSGRSWWAPFWLRS